MIRIFNKPAFRMLAAGLLSFSSASAIAADDKVNYEDHVKPIFRQACLSCHNTNKKTADLDLSNYTAMMQGGGSGEVIEPGSADDSYLFMVMNHDTEPVMPPNSDRLPDATLDIVRKWIDQGAPENSSSKVVLPKKPKVSLSVDVSAGARPEGPPPMPDVLNLEPVVHTETTTAVSAIATNPWSKLVAVAGQKQVVLYHSETMAPLGVLPFPEGQARVLKFSRNGALLLAGGGQGSARGLAVVWNIRTGERVMEVGDELDEVLAADISADQTLVALGGPQKIVRVYRTDTGELAYEITKHTDWIYSLEFSPDGVLLATGDRNGGLHVWESHTGREYLTLKDHKKAITALSFRIDGNILASGSEDTTVKLWEMNDGKAVKSWGAHGSGVLSVEFCRDGRVVSSGRDKTAKLWDQNGKQIRAFGGLKDLAVQVSHCDETDRVIAGDWTGEVRVWNAADGKHLGNLSTNPPMLAERLQVAQAELAKLQPQLQSARAALDKATAAKNDHQKKLTTATQQKAKADKTIADSKAKLTTQQKSLAGFQAQQKSLTASLQELTKVVPELKAAVDRSDAAAKMVKDDELTALVVKLREKLNAKTAEQKAAETNLAKAKTQIATLTTSTAALQKSLVDAQALQQSSAAMLKTLAGSQKAIDEQLAKAKQAVGPIQEMVNVATTDVQRWTLYAALRDKLKVEKEVAAERDEAQLASLEAEAELKAMQEQVQSMEQQMTAAAMAAQQASEKLAGMKAQVAQAEQAKAAAVQTKQKHEQTVPKLQAAKKQAAEAVALLPEQPELKQVVASLDTSLQAQAKAVAELDQKMAELTKQAQQVTAAMPAVETTIKTQQATKAQAEAKVTELTKQVAPLQQKTQETQQALAAVEAQLQKAQAEVEARREQLRPVVKVTQVSK